mmetsp:Transcript_108124/g.338210  ORF Transcript_108124/g.338210 Transcript_108124/m.338210 type:complete len:231 (-) Transcript_108124:90-782(-)
MQLVRQPPAGSTRRRSARTHRTASGSRRAQRCSRGVSEPAAQFERQAARCLPPRMHPWFSPDPQQCGKGSQVQAARRRQDPEADATGSAAAQPAPRQAAREARGAAGLPASRPGNSGQHRRLDLVHARLDLWQANRPHSPNPERRRALHHQGPRQVASTAHAPRCVPGTSWRPAGSGAQPRPRVGAPRLVLPCCGSPPPRHVLVWPPQWRGGGQGKEHRAASGHSRACVE